MRIHRQPRRLDDVGKGGHAVGAQFPAIAIATDDPQRLVGIEQQELLEGLPGGGAVAELELGEADDAPGLDGLRALAVVAVLVYHANHAWLGGGFLGVEVFFVISGYLISGIIWKQLQAQEFSFLDFYRRRIRRIFPALVTVLFVTLWLGFYVLHDSEFKLLAKHVFAAAFFLNNWVLSIEKGYFDADSEDKPLLHLWSLSIEEQFYLIWPLLLWFLFKTLKNKTHLTLAVAALDLALTDALGPRGLNEILI